MRDGFLPAAVLCAALGLLLASSSRRATWLALTALVAAAVSVSAAPAPFAARSAVLIGCWIAAALVAATVALFGPRKLDLRPALGCAVTAGCFTGAVVALGGRPIELLLTLPWALLCLPAAYLLRSGGGVGVRVVAGWLVAVALLSAGLTAVQGPTAGADHLD